MDRVLDSVHAQDVSRTVTGIKFEFYTDDEIRRLSVVRVHRQESFDTMGRAVPGGLYDSLMGPSRMSEGPCKTCGRTSVDCPGHFGHVELPFASLNPLLVSLAAKTLAASCWGCGRFRVPPPVETRILAALRFADAGMTDCVRAVQFYYGIGAPALAEFANITLKGYFKTLPKILKRALKGVHPENREKIEAVIGRVAKETWEKAADEGRLAKERSALWEKLRHEFETATTGKTCPMCGQGKLKIRLGKFGRMFVMKGKNQVMMSPMDIELQLKRIWEHSPDICELLYGQKGRLRHDRRAGLDHNVFLVKAIAVPPNRFRPASQVGTMEQAAEHPQNICFERMLKGIDILLDKDEEEEGPLVIAATPNGKSAKKKPANGMLDIDAPRTKAEKERDIAKAVQQIQDSLFFLYDNKPSKQTVDSAGIRQQLEAKSGLFRMHMMGKRVNYSCRSVIGPDMFLATDEVGLPQSFAKLLTIPEFVTSTNLSQMRNAVENGPGGYPGANAVESWTEDGKFKVTKITGKNRHALANTLVESNAGRKLPKRVLRHLVSGDVVLFNRQPTLHRVSIMAHKLRVLPGDRTIRFHYANCGSYNADFDGDEMNIHVPQDPLARAEADQLMLSSRHYINATSGEPVRGLIQDHIVAVALLSRRDRFMRRDKFCQLLYSSCEAVTSKPGYEGVGYALPVPAILKPEQLWSGKQLLSAVLRVVRGHRPGMHLETSSKTKSGIVGREEAAVLFRDGELLRGTLDKSSLGASVFGAVHGVQEVYGNEVSDSFLSCLGKLGTFFLRTHGHTAGMADLILEEHAEERRTAILDSSVEERSISTTNEVATALGMDNVEAEAKTLDEARDLTEKMVTRYGRDAEERLDVAMSNALKEVTSTVNRCLEFLQRSYPKNGFGLMTSTGAKGSIVNSAQISCILGQTSVEGKRIPRMGGSGATLPCFAPYEASARAGGFIASRFLTGLKPDEFFFHAMAGREGLLDTSLKTANSGYLQRCLVKHLEGIKLNYDYTVRDSNDNVIQFIYGDDGIDTTKESFLMKKIDWQVDNMHCLEHEPMPKDREVARLQRARRKDRRKGVDVDSGSYPTVLETLSPCVFARNGAVSEKFQGKIEEYVKRTGAGKDVASFLEYRYQRAVAAPGEPVGIIAAQGVGEPSTQMTLNTFHHTGSSSAHVNMGIPRLRELVMTASSYPKTPSMTIPILASAGHAGAKRMSQRLKFVKLSDLVITVKVQPKEMTFVPQLGSLPAMSVKITLVLPPPAVYEKALGFDFETVCEVVNEMYREKFNDLLTRECLRSIKEGDAGNLSMAVRYFPASWVHGAGSRKRRTKREKGEEDEEQEEQEGDKEGDEGEGYETKGQKKTGEDAISDDEVSSGEEDAGEADSDAGDKSDANSGSDSDESEGPFDEAKDTKAMVDETVKHVRKADDMVHFAALSRCVPNDDLTELEIPWLVPFDVIGRVQLVNIAREAAEQTHLVRVPRLTKCFITDTQGFDVVTEGSNLLAVFKLGEGLVDFSKLETNDMKGILDTYGVEALRMALVKEFFKIFDNYGIPVNMRHLSLIADYMTVHGTYRGFNRGSISDSPSPFQKMTFETSMRFLTEAALNGTSDFVKNPSAAIAVGATYAGGTGGVELLQKFDL